MVDTEVSRMKLIESLLDELDSGECGCSESGAYFCSGGYWCLTCDTLLMFCDIDYHSSVFMRGFELVDNLLRVLE